MSKILIVEDDKHISRLIADILLLSEHTFVNVYDGYKALEMVESNSFDLVLLDVMLPGLNGFEVQERIKHLDIPIIFLTALQDIQDKVKGLRGGAEDYIVKPFEPLELLARISVVLRRRNRSDDMLIYGNIEADTKRHIVLLEGEEVAVTPTEFEILLYFLRNTEVTVSREKLYKAIWNSEYSGESRTVDTHIQNLRRKLRLNDKLIAIPKVGYRLEKDR